MGPEIMGPDADEGGDSRDDGDAFRRARDALASAGFDTPDHALELRDAPARVVDVYDGDSFLATVADPGSGRAVRFACRVAGIDACEIRSRDPVLRSAARDGRAFLASLALAGAPGAVASDESRRAIRARLARRVCVFRVTTRGRDKYGRYLVDAAVADPDTGARGDLAADALVSARLAVPYSGGTRPTAGSVKAALGLAGE